MGLGAPTSNVEEGARNLSIIFLCRFCKMYQNSSCHVIYALDGKIKSALYQEVVISCLFIMVY